MTIHVTLCPENKEQINWRKLFINFSQMNTDNKKNLHQTRLHRVVELNVNVKHFVSSTVREMLK